MNSLGVVIPTRNSMPCLPIACAGMKPWLDLAEQVVVVDSDSKDGTVDYLRAHVSHPNISFFQHPPGLYQSWNFGLSQLRTEFAYVATVGDVIERDGIEKLRAIAASASADVVISKPRFTQMDGSPAEEITWPIDDLVGALKLREPRALSPEEVFLFTAAHLDGTLMGSSASNLYRTATLHAFPFPHEFGGAGDGAWGIMHFGDIKWAATPEKFSTFLRHPEYIASSEKVKWKASPPLAAILRDAGRRDTARLSKIPAERLLETASAWMQEKQAFDKIRHGSTPWFLHPNAWVIRRRRNMTRQKLEDLKNAALASLSAACIV